MLPSHSEFIQCRVFKNISGWQKLQSRRRRENLVPQAQPARAKSTSYKEGIGACPLETFCNLGLLDCISRILEQKLECLNRTQTSLNNFGFSESFFFSKKSRQSALIENPVVLDLTFYSHIQLYTVLYYCFVQIYLGDVTWDNLTNHTPTKLCSENCRYLVAVIHCAIFSLFYLTKSCISFKSYLP